MGILQVPISGPTGYQATHSILTARLVGVYRMRYILACFVKKNPIMYSIRYMDFAEAGTLIRAARQKAGITQAELASRLHMSRATISKIENGIIEELGIRKLAQVCNRLGLEILVQPRRTLTLHEAYEKNRQERREAFRETDATLAKLKPDTRG